MSSGRDGTTVKVIRGSTKRLVQKKILVWVLSIIGIPWLIAIVFLVGAVMAFAGYLSTAGSLNSEASPSDYAKGLIPANMLEIYMSETVRKECPGLSWTIVAAITHLESDDGRNAVRSSAGAIGASQFEPTTWDRAGQLIVNVKKPYGRVTSGGYALDGDGDGLANVLDPNDSVPATARMLCANGGGTAAGLPHAIYMYNHAWWYVYGGIQPNGYFFQGVLPLAAKLAASTPVVSAPGIGGNSYIYPLAKSATVIGCPFEGTHLLYQNWQSDNAVDLGTPIGTPVLAVTDGVIGSRVGALNSSASNLQGLRLTLNANGNDFFYQHLSKLNVVAGQHVIQGQVIGLSGISGVAHLHFGMHARFNPARAIGLSPNECIDWAWPPWLPLDATAENGSPLLSS